MKNNNHQNSNESKKNDKVNYMKHLRFPVVLVVLTVLLLRFLMYLTKTTLNIHFVSSWILAGILFFGINIAFQMFATTLSCDRNFDREGKFASIVEFFDFDSEHFFIVDFCIPAGFFLIVLLAVIFSGPMFNAKSWYQNVAPLVTEMDGDGEEAFQQFKIDGSGKNLPINGQEEAIIKGDTLLGSETGLTSRFSLDREWTSQEINGSFYLVNELEPKSIFRWDKSEGNMGYVIVNRSTGETEHVKDTLYYTVDAPFSNNVRRLMKNAYPNIGIAEICPEVDDNGNFYYVATTYGIDGVGGFKTVTGVIVMDAVSGEMVHYTVEDTPAWIDRIYPESIFQDYVKTYGAYKEGFWNSLFAKKGVVVPTEGIGVTYDVNTGDCLYYTGFTGAGNKNSSAGIVMMNARTGQMTFYKVGQTGGISEKRAQLAIEGKVSDFGYTAAYPLLMTIGGEKTFFSLCHSEGSDGAKEKTLMGYAFVSYNDTSKVAFATTLRDARAEYIKLLGRSNTADDLSNEDSIEQSGIISAIAHEVSRDSGSQYIFRLEGSSVMYVVTPEECASICFAQPGDEIEFRYVPVETGERNGVVVVTKHTEVQETEEAE